MPSLYLK